MQYSEFLAAVDQHLTVDANRQASSFLKQRLIQDAIWDLQFYIPAFRNPGATLVTAGQMSSVYRAMSYALPLGRRVLGTNLVVADSDGFPIKYPMCPVCLDLRHKLTLGELTTITPLDDGSERIEGLYWTFDPREGRVYLSPSLASHESVEFVWDSFRQTFLPEDILIWFPDAIWAVANWTKAHMLREIHEDEAGYRSYLASYFDQRSNLYLHAKDYYEFPVACNTVRICHLCYVRVYPEILVPVEPVEAGLVLSTTSIITTEAGGSSTFQVSLTRPPYGPLQVFISSPDVLTGEVDVSNLTFFSDAWDTPQTVTVTGRSDFATDGDREYDLTLTVSCPDDAGFDGLTSTVHVVNTDVDMALPLLAAHLPEYLTWDNSLFTWASFRGEGWDSIYMTTSIPPPQSVTLALTGFHGTSVAVETDHEDSPFLVWFFNPDLTTTLTISWASPSPHPHTISLRTTAGWGSPSNLTGVEVDESLFELS
jgi:hypothetical protein